MAERWRTELKKFDRLHPDHDLVERAATRPLRPLPAPRAETKIAIVAFALLIAAAGSYGAFTVLRSGSLDTHPAGGDRREAVSPHGNGELLYSKYVGTEGWSLFAVDPETSRERRITHGVRDYGSDWSPDGTKVVYDSEIEGTGEGNIVVANADGSDPVVVGSGDDPAWSPDGSRIAYAGDGGCIWLMNVDGSDAHPVTEGAAAGTGKGDDAAYDWSPAWSPDGRSIAYSRVVEQRYASMPNGESRTHVTLEEVRVWNDGAETEAMLTDAYTHIGDLDWSPDGSTIVFTGAPTLFHEKTTDGSTSPRVLLIPSAGGRATPISPDERSWSSGATWSPDGRWIAYVDNSVTIVVMRVDGSNRRTLSVNAGEDEIIGPSWGAAAPSQAGP